jgi:hypothetical protein
MAMKVAGTSTNASIGYLGIRQVIEDFRILSGQIVTASMWIRTNLRSMTFRHDSTTNFGDYVTPDGEWHYHTATYQMPTITSAGRLANQTTLAIINYTGSAGGGVTSGEYFEVAQVQLELGKVATPFEHRSYGEELALCQRYYQASQGTGYNNGFVLVEYSDRFRGRYIFPVTMRADPTVVTDFTNAAAYSGSNSLVLSGLGWGTDNQKPTGFRVNSAVQSTTLATVAYMNDWDWTADAEL